MTTNAHFEKIVANMQDLAIDLINDENYDRASQVLNLLQVIHEGLKDEGRKSPDHPALLELTKKEKALAEHTMGDPASRVSAMVRTIKAYRERTGLGLKESKDIIEKYMCLKESKGAIEKYMQETYGD